MEVLLSLSKEERISRRRTRIKEKLGASEKDVKTVKEVSNKIEKKTVSKNNFEETTKDGLILEKVKQKKENLINELSNEINKETRFLLDNIRQFEMVDDSVLKNGDDYVVTDLHDVENDANNEGKSIIEITKFDSKIDLAEIHTIVLREKETYSKKIEKYFALLYYKDIQIQEMCQIRSTNFSSLMNLMKDQIEGYKIYLEGIYNKTRDKLIDKRRKLLNDNKKILEDFMKLQNMYSDKVAIEIMEDVDQLNDKIRVQCAENNATIEVKSELLKKKLKSNVEFVKNISSIIIDREKNIYGGKMLMQKNNYNSKMINFYKLEINKLREALLSVKTHYYNYKIKSKKIINELINQYERIKFQFIELQKRQKNYEHHFQNTYAAAWELQKKEVKIYIDKLIAANKIIHEQIFLTTYQDNNQNCLIEENINMNIDTIDEKKSKIKCLSLKQVTPLEIEHVKKLLLQECSFIIERNNQHDTDEEKFKQILKYIGVHNEQDLELLTGMFYLETEERVNKKEREKSDEDKEDKEEEETRVKGKGEINKNEDEETEAEAEENETFNGDDEDNMENQDIASEEKIEKEKRVKKIKSICVAPEYTLDIISKYCKEKEKEMLYKMPKGKQKYTNVIRLNISLKLIIERKKKEKEYWDMLSHVISENMVELWKTFLVFTKEYFNILKERATTIDNIQKEEKQAKEYIKTIKYLKEVEKK